jgi:hypothetical protein
MVQVRWRDFLVMCICKIWSFHSGTVVDSHLLGCYAVLLGMQFLGFAYFMTQHNITKDLNLHCGSRFKWYYCLAEMHKTRHATLMQGSTAYSLFKLKLIGNLWQSWPHSKLARKRTRVGQQERERGGGNIKKEKGTVAALFLFYVITGVHELIHSWDWIGVYWFHWNYFLLAMLPKNW